MGGDAGEVWLIEPWLVDKAKAAFWADYSGAGDETKQQMKITVEDHYGSLEWMNKLTWLVYNAMPYIEELWPNFKTFLEHVAFNGQWVDEQTTFDYTMGFYLFIYLLLNTLLKYLRGLCRGALSICV